MLGLLQLGGGIGNGGEEEGLVRLFKGQRIVTHVQLGLAGEAVAAALLGHQIVGHLGRFLMAAEDAALIPVRVGLAGVAYPGGFLYGLGGGEPQAEQGQLRGSRKAMVEGLDGEHAFPVHPISDLRGVARQGGKAKAVGDGEVVCPPVHIPACAALPGIRGAPQGAARWEAAA